MVAHLREWPQLTRAEVVLLFFPLADEVDLTGLLSAGLGCRFVATRTPSRDGDLSVHVADDHLETHRLGFLQPGAEAAEVGVTDVDVFLVPGLAFGRDGSRLGRGGGYFDRLLSRARGDAARVGIAPGALVVDAVPAGPGDVAMTHLATETGVDAVAREPELPSATRRFITEAAELGLEVGVREFPAGTKTAAAAAAAVGCAVAAIVKSLVFMAGDEPVLVLMPGDLRVDLDKLAAAVGRPVRRATLAEVREHTGYAAGGTPPFGGTVRRRFVDRRLRRHAEVWAAAGTPTTVFPVPPARLIEAAQAVESDLAAGS